jgi:deoxyadenosine/deoxycytidine kinase
MIILAFFFSRVHTAPARGADRTTPHTLMEDEVVNLDAPLIACVRLLVARPTGCVVAIMGNIGAGKTRFAGLLVAALQAHGRAATVVVEPTLDSLRVLFANFCREPTKYAFPLQMATLKTRRATLKCVNAQLEKSGGANERSVFRILERGLTDDKAFAMANHKMGNMSREQLDAYMDYAGAADKADPLAPPALFIHMNTPPAQCFYNIHTLRRRAGEAGITMDYLNILHAQYTTAIAALVRASGPFTVVQIDIPDSPPASPTKGGTPAPPPARRV